jgi:hypothetical protein
MRAMPWRFPVYQLERKPACMKSNFSSWTRTKHRLAHSIKLRMVLVFFVAGSDHELCIFHGGKKSVFTGLA